MINFKEFLCTFKDFHKRKSLKVHKNFYYQHFLKEKVFHFIFIEYSEDGEEEPDFQRRPDLVSKRGMPRHRIFLSCCVRMLLKLRLPDVILFFSEIKNDVVR